MLLRSPTTLEYRRQRLGQYLDVEPERPLIHVLKIEKHPLVERDSTAAVDLPKAGNSRFHAEPPPLPIFIEALIIANRQWSWAYQTHVTVQHVKQLRKFIDATSSQEFANWRDPRIIL